MSLRALRTMQAIAEHGSFARAGNVVGLTQSAVSLQVKALEEEFGATLFDRSRRVPVLTEAGRIVLSKSQEVLSLYDSIFQALSDEHSLAGRLRLGVIHTALSSVVPEALASLKLSHPRVRIHVTGGMSLELATQVASGGLDAAITTEPVKPFEADLIWQPLYEEKFWLIAPAEKQRHSVRELLSDLPFIRFDNRAWAGRMIDRELRRLGLEVRDEMVLDSLHVIFEMVAKDLGVAIVPGAAVYDSREIAYLPFGDPQLVRKVVLLQRPDHVGSPIATAVATAVVAAKEASDAK